MVAGLWAASQLVTVLMLLRLAGAKGRSAVEVGATLFALMFGFAPVMCVCIGICL